MAGMVPERPPLAPAFAKRMSLVGPDALSQAVIAVPAAYTPPLFRWTILARNPRNGRCGAYQAPTMVCSADEVGKIRGSDPSIAARC